MTRAPQQHHSWSFSFRPGQPGTSMFWVESPDLGFSGLIDMESLLAALEADGYPPVVIADAVATAVENPGDEVGLVGAIVPRDPNS